MTPQEEYLKPFFEGLNAMDGMYCVLHTYESLPYTAEGDIDIAILGIARPTIEGMMLALCRKFNWSLTQRLWYDVPECFYYVLSSNMNKDVTVKIDLLFDKYAVGYTHYSTSFLTHNPVMSNNIRHSNETVEFCYKLTKRIWKGYFTDTDPGLLNTLYRKSHKTIVSQHLDRQYGKKYSAQLLALFNSETGFTGVIDNKNNISKHQKLRYKYGSINRFILRLKWQLQRNIHRVMYPCGAIVNLPPIYSAHISNIKTKLSTASIDSFRLVNTSSDTSSFERFMMLAASTLLLTVDNNLTDTVTLKTGYIGLSGRVSIISESNDIETLIPLLDDLICSQLRTRMLVRLQR